MKLRGRGAVITGASQGLGAALARGLARRGARVVAVARNSGPLERLVDELRREGLEAHALAYDVGNKQAVHPLAYAAAALVGDIDLLIHNASTLGPTPLKLLLDTACEELQQVLEVNLLGPFRLTRIIAGSMALRGQGQVVHVSSDAAISAYARWGAYGVSKAALDHLSRTFAAELEGTGVRFLSVDPGEMDTQMHADAMPEADRTTLARPDRVAEQLIQILESGAPLTGSRLGVQRWSPTADGSNL